MEGGGQGNASNRTWTGSGFPSCSTTPSLYDRTECGRTVASFVLALPTLVLCGMKIRRLYLARQLEPMFFIVFILAFVEMATLLLKWSCGHGCGMRPVYVHFAALYLARLQSLLLCLFYGRLAVKIARKPYLITRVCYPIACLFVVYFSGVTAYAIATVGEDHDACKNMAWLLFSSSNFALCSTFMLAGWYLTKAMAVTGVSELSRKYAAWKKFTLWALIIAYFFAAVVDFAIDLFFWYANLKTNEKCDAKIGSWNGHLHLICSCWATFTFYEITQRFCFMLPIWVQLYSLKSGAKRIAMRGDENVLWRDEDRSAFPSNRFGDDSDGFGNISTNSGPSDTQPLLSGAKSS